MSESSRRDREMARQFLHNTPPGDEDEIILAEMFAAARAEERARWMECARYDATMEGPKFMTWNRSALDRLRRECEAVEEPRGERGS